MSAKVPLKFPLRRGARGLTGISESRFKGTRTTRSTTFHPPTEKTIGTSGMTIATTSSSPRRVGSTPILSTPAHMILTTMDTGGMYPTTEASGFPKVAPTGRHTAMAGGYLSPTTAGLGFPTNLGAGRRTTTVAGSFMEETGAGGLDLCTADTIRSGRRHTFPSSVFAVEAGSLELAFAAALGIFACMTRVPALR